MEIISERVVRKTWLMQLYRRFNFETVVKVKATLFRYIEVWYNKQRMHSSLGYMCPIDYEKRVAKKQ